MILHEMIENEMTNDKMKVTMVLLLMVMTGRFILERSCRKQFLHGRITIQPDRTGILMTMIQVLYNMLKPMQRALLRLLALAQAMQLSQD